MAGGCVFTDIVKHSGEGRSSRGLQYRHHIVEKKGLNLSMSRRFSEIQHKARSVDCFLSVWDIL